MSFDSRPIILIFVQVLLVAGLFLAFCFILLQILKVELAFELPIALESYGWLTFLIIIRISILLFSLFAKHLSVLLLIGIIVYWNASYKCSASELCQRQHSLLIKS